MEKSIVENTFRNLWPAELFLATADQLRAAGLGPRIVAEGVRLGLLLRLRRGVYIPRHRWAGTPPWQQAKIRLAAHIAASQRTVTYTYFSAARLHGLHVWDCAPDIHVNVGYQSSPGKSANDVKVHCLPIAGCEIVRKQVPGFGSVCMSSLARTVLDCAMEGIICTGGGHRGLGIAQGNGTGRP